jgi:hypothetical protein
MIIRNKNGKFVKGNDWAYKPGHEGYWKVNKINIRSVAAQ